MQNLIKSAFISLFPVFALVVAGKSGWNLVEQSFTYQDLGILISAIGVASFFALIFVFKRARTDQYLTGYSILVALGTIIGFYGIFVNGFSMLPFLILMVLVFGWLAYLFWYSSFEGRNKNSKLVIGKLLPSFQLEDEKRKVVVSNTFKGKPSIFLFYRGNWCPLCMAQVKEISNQYKDLEKRGVNMVLISPQPHKYTRKLAKKFNVGFHFLVDVKNKAAKQLGLDSKFGIPMGFQIFGYESDTVLPTVIITNKNGEIIFLNQTDNYRLRPEPDTFLNILDQYNS